MIAILAPSGASAAECTNTYNGPSEGAWGNAENWSAEHAPTESDVACVGSGKTAKLTSGSHRVGILQGAGAVSIEGSTLELMSTGEASVLNNMIVTSWGVLSGPGTLEIANHLTWAGGELEAAMLGSGTTVIAPGATVSDIAKYNARIEERTFINEGAFNLEKGDLYLGSGAKFINKGTVDVTTSAENAVYAAAPQKFVNIGTFERSEGSGLVYISAPFENEGSVDARAGNLYFRAGVSSTPTATWEAQEGARISFNGNSSFTFNEGSISGSVKLISVTMNLAETNLEAAEIELEGGNLSVLGSVAIPVLTMGNASIVSGPGTLEIFEHLTWAGSELGARMSGSGTTLIPPGATVTGTPKYVAELHERTFLNEGTFDLESGTLGEGGGAEFINKGTFDATTSAESAIYGSAEETFVNQGTFERTGGSGGVYIYPFFENKGAVDAQAGNLYFRGGGTATSAATWEAQEGARLSFNGNSPFNFTNGSISGSVKLISVTMIFDNTDLEAAEVEQEGGTIEVTGTTPIGDLMMDIGAKLTGAGTLEISKHLTWAGGAYEVVMSGIGTTVIAPGATVSAVPKSSAFLEERIFINEGTFDLEEGDLSMGGGAAFINQGTFDVTSSAEAAIEGSTEETFINLGTFEKTAGTGTQIVAPSFKTSGEIKELTGEFEFLNPDTAETSNHFSKECETGDPVNCSTGNFSETQTDIAIGGLGVGLGLTRTYSAQAAATAVSPGSFGYGWTASFSDRLVSEEEGERITLLSPDGGTVPFTKGGESTFKAPSWSQDTLSGSSEAGYTLILPSQVEEAFSGTGKLESVTDRNGNETTLAYNEAGRLEAITDPVGRELTFTYNGSGRVETVEDPMGHIVKYGYESTDLTSVTMPGEAEPRWQFKYDGSHRITKVTNGRGGKTTNEYDGSDRVISQTDPAGRTLTFEYAPFHTAITNSATGSITDERFTSNHEPYSITHAFGTELATTETFTYNGAGRLLSATDGNGHKTTYTYDSNGNRKSQKGAAGNETKWTYNETHDVLTETAPSGEKTTILRDGAGNPESISRPAPEASTQTTSITYGPHGEPESMTDPRGYSWTYDYDAQGNLEAEIDPEGDKQTWTYNEDSLVESAVSPRGNVEGTEAAKYTTTYEYTPSGDVSKITDPLEGEVLFSYDRDRNLESMTDSNGHETTYVYNSSDQPIETIRADSSVLESLYDENGNLEAQIDAAGKATEYTYDLREQLASVTDPLNRTTEYKYDLAGNLEEMIDPMERVTTYGFDQADRLTSVRYSDGETPEASFGYDKNGNRISMTDGTGESTFKYDALDRLNEATQQGTTVNFGYDLANNETSVTYPGSHKVIRAFDKANRLESVTDWSGHETSFGYDPDSDPTSTTFPPGTSNIDEYGYDRADQVTSVAMTKGEATAASLAYTRDPMGQLENEEQSGLPGSTTSLGYTTLDQLSSAGSSAYGYDTADNMTKLAGASTYGYDEANELKSIPSGAPEGPATLGYDALGERTELNPETGPTIEYDYDQAGRLTGVASESHTYGGDGLRLSTTTGVETQHFSWDRNGAVPLLLTDGSTRYIYGPGGIPIEQVTAGGATTYYHHDQLGSTRMLTDSSGEVTGSFSYTPYGVPAGSTGEQTTPLGYAGQYTDPVSGLQYLRARYYDPATGQFVSRDPLNVLSRSPYGYVNSNPLNAVDPSGLLTIGACLSFSTSIVGPLGGSMSTCVQASSSGEVGVTGTVGTQASAGTPSAIAGPAVQASNADHISELAGPFVHAGGQAAAGGGAFAQGFAGRSECDEPIVGFMAGPVAGAGYGAEVGVTNTYHASTSIGSIGHAFGDAIDKYFTPHVPTM
jgi:RHS repeat-associated protein